MKILKGQGVYLFTMYKVVKIEEDPDHIYGPCIYLNSDRKQRLPTLSKKLETVVVPPTISQSEFELLIDKGYDIVYIFEKDEKIQTWEDFEDMMIRNGIYG